MENKGFTLIEVLVSISLLMVVTSGALAIFMSVISGQKAVLAGQQVSGQLSYALEYISKSLRMAGRDSTGNCLGQDKIGYNYMLTRPDSLTGDYRGVKFINQSDNNICQEFYLDDSDPSKAIIVEVKNSGDPVPLTSDKLKINYFKFVINGDTKNQSPYSFQDDGIQPRLTVLLGATVLGSNVPIKIQTTISQRNINIK